MTASKSRIARERGSEPEITAQPRPITEEMISGTDSETGLSVDPEDLGAHFLSEATEQGNFQSVSGGQGLELSIASAPPSDEAAVGPNFESEHSVWEQTVDLALQNPELEGMTGASELTTQQEERDNLGSDSDVRVTESHIRELSLFDRESDELGETTEPDAPAEDGGRHARQTSHVPLGAQVEDTQRRTGSAKSAAKRGPKLLGGTRSALKGVATKLRHVAKKLERSIPGSRRSR
jgi:hypothetical protein